MGLQLLLEEMARCSRQLEGPNKEQDSKKVSHGQQKLQENLKEWSTMSQDILSNAYSAVGVLTDLLNYDKIESQSLSLELEVIPIIDVVRETANEFQLQAQF